MSINQHEIRYNILQLAHNICNDRNYAARARIENDWGVLRDEWSMRAASGDFSHAPPYPEMPTVKAEEVVEEARKLLDFVSNG